MDRSEELCFTGASFTDVWKSGTTEASRQSLGTSPMLSESWNSFAKARANSVAIALRMKAGMASGPVALLVWRLISSL